VAVEGRLAVWMFDGSRETSDSRGPRFVGIIDFWVKFFNSFFFVEDKSLHQNCDALV